MTNEVYSIYRFTNQVNGKIYIGWTSQKPSERWDDHKIRPSTRMTYFANAIKKHGWENFKKEVIYQSWDWDHSLEMETHFILSHQSIKREIGYNSTTGGKQPKDSEEFRIKKSLIQKGAPWKIKTHTDEARAKITAAQTGKKHSEERKRIARKAQRRNNILYQKNIFELIILMRKEGVPISEIAIGVGVLLNQNIIRSAIKSVIGAYEGEHKEKIIPSDAFLEKRKEVYELSKIQYVKSDAVIKKIHQMRKETISFVEIYKKIDVAFDGMSSRLSSIYESECKRVTGEEPLTNIIGLVQRKNKDHFRPDIVEVILKLTECGITQKKIAETVNQAFNVDIKFWNVNHVQKRYVR